MILTDRLLKVLFLLFLCHFLFFDISPLRPIKCRVFALVLYADYIMKDSTHNAFLLTLKNASKLYSTGHSRRHKELLNHDYMGENVSRIRKRLAMFRIKDDCRRCHLAFKEIECIHCSIRITEESEAFSPRPMQVTI